MNIGELVYDFVFNGARGLQNLERAEQAVDALEQCLRGVDSAVVALEQAVARHIEPIVEDAIRAGAAFEEGLAEGLDESAAAARAFGRDLERTDDQIDDASRSSRGLAGGLDRVDDELGQASRAAAVFSASLAGIRRVGAGVGRAMGSLQAQIAGVVTVYGVLNANTRIAETQTLADSLGASVETLTGLGALAGRIGFDISNVSDLIEESNNKVGEFFALGEQSSVSDALKILNIQAAELEGLNPEQTFLRIADAIKLLPDQAQAVSAADIIFGGEANRFFGLLRQYEGSVDDVIGRFNELNFVTNQHTRTAELNSQAMGRARRAVTSIFDAFSILLVDALRPSIEAFVQWVRVNRELVATRIQEYAERAATAFQAVVGVISNVVGVIDRAIDGFSRLGLGRDALLAIGATLGAIFAPFATTLLALILLLEDFAVFMQGGDSLIGSFADGFEAAGERIMDTVRDIGNTIDRFGVEPINRFIAALNRIPGVSVEGIGEVVEGPAPRSSSSVAASAAIEGVGVLGSVVSLARTIGEARDSIFGAAPVPAARAVEFISGPQSLPIGSGQTTNVTNGYEIYINGANSPEETGQSVRREIDRINSDTSFYATGVR